MQHIIRFMTRFTSAGQANTGTIRRLAQISVKSGVLLTMRTGNNPSQTERETFRQPERNPSR